MSVAVVVPWRPGCPRRELAWRHVRSVLEREHPDALIVEATGPPGPWVKAHAVNPAVHVLPADVDVVVMHDADVLCDLHDALAVVAARVTGWAIPHSVVHRLDATATDLLMTGRPVDLRHLVERPYRGVQGGGIVVARRDVIEDVPLDPRYEGWGQEDMSWGIALHHLHGPAWRGSLPLLHLWHPPQARLNRKVGSPRGHDLHRRYLRARRHPDELRQIIEEAKACSASTTS